MGPTWGLEDPGGPHVGLMNLAIWDVALAATTGTGALYSSQVIATHLKIGCL